MAKYYESHPWGIVRPHAKPTPEAVANRDMRLADRDPVRQLTGDPPKGWQRTELRDVESPSINPTLGVGVVVRRQATVGRPGSSTNHYASVSLRRISLLEAEPA
jgi:hypothetical protein